MARSKNTPEVRAAIVQSVRNGNYAKHAAGAAGINERTLYDWIEKDDQFAAAVTRARDEFTNESIQMIRASDDWRARAWVLERTRPQDFRESSQVEHSGQVSLEAILAENLKDIAK